MPLVWTKEARAELSPLRSNASPPNLSYDLEALRSAIVDVLDGEKPKLSTSVKRKLGDVELAQQVLASYKDFDTTMDARIQGALVTVLRGWGNKQASIACDLVRHWITRGGLPFAVRAQYEHAILHLMHPQGKAGFDFEVAFLEPERTGGWSLFGLKPEEVRPVLADAILAAPDDVYAEVVATVGELRKKTKNPMLRCDLSALVPTERAWALEDVRAALRAKKQTPLDLKPAAFLFPALGRCDESRELFDKLVENAFVLRAHVYDAVRALEDDAIAPLAGALHAFEKEPPKQNMGLAEARHLARALALFDDERVAKAFTPWIGDAKSFGPIAVDYMQRFPAHAIRSLAPRLLEKTKGAEPAQHLLERIARAHPNDVREAASKLSKDQRAAVEKLLGAPSAPRASAAAASDVPEVLRDPPWRRKGTRPSLPIVATLDAPKYDERVVWDDEAQRTAAMKGTGYGVKDLAAIRKKIANAVRLGEGNTPTWERAHIAWPSLHDDDAVLEMWNDTPIWARGTTESSYFSEVAHMLARFGTKAIPGAIASAGHTMYETPFAALMRCDSPRVARLAMRGLGRGLLRHAASGYFRAFPEAAAIGLLPIALGPGSRDKADAASALRQHVDHDRLHAIAKRFGDEAARGLEGMLAFDPAFDCPKSPPKLSAFADPATLPPLRLAGGGELPDDAKRNFLEMLQFTSFDAPYVGLATAKAALDPGSVDELLRALVDAWVAAGAATASAWALRAVGHVGSDAMARELAAKIRKWPREKGRARALLGVDVLARMGTDVALMHLFDLSKTAKNKRVEARAKEALDEAASARGLSGDALEDRLVPSLELDRDGTTTLDYGTRSFTVRVDEHLAPHVFDGQTRLPSLPRATKTDDAAKAKAAAARYKTLASDLGTLAKTQLWRFEHAMIKGRRWDAGEHRALLVDHPLAGRISRKLVWAVFDGDAPRTTFRVAEDGTLADDRDAPLELDADARVGIPHTLVIDAAAKARWSTLLGDYAIIQPFEQIARPTFAIEASERKKKSLDRFGKREIPYGVVFGRLESRGWRRGTMEEGSISTLEKDFGAVSATLSFSPSLFAREKPPSEITIDDVSFGGAALGELPAIAFSEAMFDLSVFAPK